MNTLALENLESAISQLSLLEQVRLLERLAQRVRKQTERQQSPDDELAAMAADPAIQHELRQIEAEFSETEMDGLPEEATAAKET
jgi:uncharacterized protein YPO0396